MTHARVWSVVKANAYGMVLSASGARSGRPTALHCLTEEAITLRERGWNTHPDAGRIFPCSGFWRFMTSTA
ncbi:hypothetical protein ACNKHP_01975 [Shigella boydii]